MAWLMRGVVSYSVGGGPLGFHSTALATHGLSAPLLKQTPKKSYHELRIRNWI